MRDICRVAVARRLLLKMQKHSHAHAAHDVEDTMDTFAPELTQFWLVEDARDDGVALAGADEGSEAAALEALADRVNAARSIV